MPCCHASIKTCTTAPFDVFVKIMLEIYVDIDVHQLLAVLLVLDEHAAVSTVTDAMVKSFAYRPLKRTTR